MKRCSRCQAVYTDEVRWCPADGTPTEEVAPSPAALAAAANHISEGAPTLHDMPAVGPGTAGWNESPPVQRAPHANATMIGAPSPLPRMPSSPPSDNPVGDTLRGAHSPVPHHAVHPPSSAPVAPYSPNATMIGPQASTQPTPAPAVAAYAPNATMIGPQASTQPPAATPSQPGAPSQPASSPLNATMIGGVSPFAQRGPALSPELAKLASTIPSGPTNAPSPAADAGVQGPSTIQGSPEVRAPAQPTPPPPLSAPSTVPGALIPPIQSPLMSTFTGTTSEPPRTPHGSSTSPADLGPQGNTFMGAPSPVPRAPAPPTPTPSTVPGALVPPIHSPLPRTFTGATPPPRTPHGSSTTPAELAPASLTSTPVAPAAHTPGPVSQGWDIPDLPTGSSLTGTPTATSPASLAAAATVEGPRPNTTLQGFAPSPEVLRAIQEQRAKLAAQQAGQTQPLAAPEIAAEAYIPSGTSTPAESYASMAVAHSTAMTAVGSATDPSMPAPPIPLNSTLPALSPLPMQPAVVLMASQQVASAISQAPLPSVSMPHAVAPAPVEAVVVSQSMTMAAAQLPSAPKPPTASLLEAPPFQAAAAAAAAKSSAGDTDQHRAVGSNRTLWIVFAVIAVAMIGATIAILVTR